VKKKEKNWNKIENRDPIIFYSRNIEFKRK